MAVILLVARVTLALVFLAAGLTKVFDRNGTSKAITDFGFPVGFANPASIGLPVLELVISGLLIPLRFAWAGSIGAGALLLLFISVISFNMAKGRKPDCHCFGQIHAEPIGWRTLARNIALAGFAGLVVVMGRQNAGVSAVDWWRNLTPAIEFDAAASLAIAIGLLAEGWFLLNLARQNGRLLLRIEDLEKRLGFPAIQPPQPMALPIGLAIGTRAPTFELPLLSGEVVGLDSLHNEDKPALLVFSDPNCGPCAALMPRIGQWQAAYAKQLTIAVVSRGNVEANLDKAREHRVINVMLQKDRELAEKYQANGTPAAVLIRPGGRIGSGVAMGAEAISGLVAQATGSALLVGANGNRPKAAQRLGLPIGHVAPPIILSDLAGKNIRTQDFRGTQTVLLFWNPSCGFCQQMLPNLKAWERERLKNAPQLTLVSTGTIESNRAMELRSRVLIDPTFGVAQSFHAGGTPSAVMLDCDGNVASELVVGASGVLDLLSGQTIGAGV